MNVNTICTLCMEIYKEEPYCYNYDFSKLKQVVNNWNANGLIITCKVNNELVGFLGGYYINKDTLYLDKIGIKKKYRNKKLGSKMMEELVKINTSILLRINDKKLENFYSKFGFFYTGIYKTHGHGMIKDRYYLYLH